ncbi:hypothetical protein AGMMS49928_19040 [Spirochaetia bacterium]|nr:hypothetical protein AGMMS49928_19040 [Spirochaetia bacterium]
MYRTRAVKAVKKDFLATVPISHEVTLKDCVRNALQRIFQDVLRLFVPLM